MFRVRFWKPKMFPRLAGPASRQGCGWRITPSVATRAEAETVAAQLRTGGYTRVSIVNG